MDFDTWLSERLQELKTDEAVFGPYIKSILEGDEELDQKIDDLDGILSELGKGLDVESLRKEVLSRWDAQLKSDSSSTTISTSSSNANSNTILDGSSSDKTLSEETGSVSKLESQLEKLLLLSPEELLGASATTASASKDASAPDSALRAAILKQYQQEGSDSEDSDGTGLGGISGLSKNMNAERVQAAQREFKEKQREDAVKKREKDREDRAKQKKLAEEKKDKAKKKTAKVERKTR